MLLPIKPTQSPNLQVVAIAAEVDPVAHVPVLVQDVPVLVLVVVDNKIFG